MGMTRRLRAGAVLDALAIREIRDDCLILRAVQAKRSQQEYQAVLQVDPVNFALLAESEQLGIFARYRAFLAGRTPADGPLCIHARTSRYDITPYLEQLEQTALTHPVAGYRQMARSHQQFVEQLAATRALLSREFWVRLAVVIDTRARSFRHLTAEEVFEHARAELTRKAQALIDGLDRVGLVSRRLRSVDLANYYLRCLVSDVALSRLTPDQLTTLDFPVQVEAPGGQRLGEIPSRALLAPALPQGLEPVDAVVHAPAPPASLALAEARRWVRLSPHQLARQKRQHERRRPPDLLEGKSNDQTALPDWVSLPELLQPASLEETPHYVRVHTQGDEYVRARAVVGYPASVYPGWLDGLLSIDEPDIDVLLFLTPLDPARYVKSLGRRLTSYRATQMVDARHGRTENPYIEAAREEVEQLRERLVAKTEQVHAVSLYVLARASSKHTVRARDQKVAQVLKNLEMQSAPFQFEHLPAYLSGVDGRDTLRRGRVLPTSVVACLFPFCSHDVSTEPGALVGITPSEGLIFLNPISPQLENGHTFTLGQTGAGKSMTEKLALMRYLELGWRAVVVDPDNEYGKIGERLEGANVSLSPADLRINPFDLGPPQGEPMTLKEKLEALLALFDLLLADRDTGQLRQTEKGALHAVLMRAYAAAGITADPGTYHRPVPCMQDVFDLLRAEGDPHGIGERLARFLPAFPRQTTVDLGNQLVIFNIKPLKDTSEELLRAGLYLIAEYVWGTVRSRSTPQPCLLFIDEAWTLLEFPEGGRFLESLSRRARKYNLHLRLTTQHVNDLVATKAGQSILLNSATKVLMRHDEPSLDTLARIFKLSEGERRSLSAAGKGQGLLFCRSSHTAFYAVPSPEEYRLANTNVQELLLEAQAREAQWEEEAARAEQEARAVEASRDDLQVLFPSVYAPARQEREEES